MWSSVLGLVSNFTPFSQARLWSMLWMRTYLSSNMSFKIYHIPKLRKVRLDMCSDLSPKFFGTLFTIYLSYILKYYICISESHSSCPRSLDCPLGYQCVPHYFSRAFFKTHRRSCILCSPGCWGWSSYPKEESWNRSDVHRRPRWSQEHCQGVSWSNRHHVCWIHGGPRSAWISKVVWPQQPLF